MKLHKRSKIFIAGHNGMVGSSLVRYFKKKKYQNIITKDKKFLNLINQKQTENYIKKIKPDFIIIAAARVGGIGANNKFKAEFIYENISIQTNLIHAAYKSGVRKLIFLGSSCIYPKSSKQPIKENYLLSGKLEPTNDAYAIAKIAGIKMCEAYNNQYKLNYICLMPTNLYGPNDNYNLSTSHFFPALIRKVATAKKNNSKYLDIWGNGKSKRELMYVDDLAHACEFFLKKKTKHSLINIGSGIEKSIEDYSKFIMKKLNIKLKLRFDKKKPNGVKRKIIDSSLAKKYGWKYKFELDKGFELTLKDFLKKKFI
jgi:GDP-L-fucose synthase